MEKLGLNTLRTMFLAFFESKGHYRLESAPLVPQNDNSLLLINSGMAPLKPYFTGEIAPPAPRAVSCQKCIRTPDIEVVGKDARHGTYFEMLGNFSFGDYFKRDAQKWAWEFITTVVKMPVDKLYVTVYLDDDEAYDIWANEIGVDPTHISRLGKADNFWEIGVGPCGPCSEIYFDRGEKYGCGSKTCAPGCDCDRYVEFWNLVFTQYNNDGQGNYTPLAKKNIDTGMGLERIACLVQGVESLFDVDTMARIIAHISQISNVKYGENAKNDLSLRIITDHIRSTTMMICDGVMPSNIGRGYVLRRLLRRAARHGRLLGVNVPFLRDVCETVIKENEQAYPALREKENFIKAVISSEEERFGGMIEQGLIKLELLISTLKFSGSTQLSGEEAFKLYDTDGFPIDLTAEILEEHGFSVDREGFDSLMQNQRKRAKSARGNTAELGWENEDVSLRHLSETVFEGYEINRCKAKILAIIMDGFVSAASEGDIITIVLDRTPFYAESGGQSADFGELRGQSATLDVLGVKKSPDGKYLHKCRVFSGEITLGDDVEAVIDTERRQAIRRAHSATHLLQNALREVLGKHVEQSGSLVEPDILRFDFSHFEACKAEQLYSVENAVNRAILLSHHVECRQMRIDEAKRAGAIALFGEKYGEMVRVVSMGGSTELCGGTHIENTSQIGLFKITSESSVAAGIRRIEASVGLQTLNLFRECEHTLSSTAATLKTNTNELVRRSAQVMDELRILSNEKSTLESRLAGFKAVELMQNAQKIGEIRVLATVMDDGMTIDALRTICDSLRDRASDLVAVLASKQSDGKASFAAVCGTNAMKAGAHAGNIVKQTAAICGGGGGGKPDSATAGGKNADKINDAVSAVTEIVSAMLDVK